MKYHFRFGQNNLFAVFKASGKPDTGGLKKLLDDFLNNPASRSVKKVLLDLSELHIRNVTSGEVRQFINTQKYSFKRLDSPLIAVVVSRPVDFGVVRMCGTLAENMIPDYQVFYKVEQALEWLSPETSGHLRLKTFSSMAL